MTFLPRIHTITNTIGETEISYDFYLMFRCDVIVIFHFSLQRTQSTKERWMNRWLILIRQILVFLVGYQYFYRILIRLYDYYFLTAIFWFYKSHKISHTTKSHNPNNLFYFVAPKRIQFDTFWIIVVMMKLQCDSFSFTTKKNCLFTPIVTLGVVFGHSLFW